MKLLLTEDGSHTLENEQLGITYHSIHGAIQETQTVFIEAGLKHLIAQQQEQYPTISILDIGLGTGLNAFMTYLEAQHHPIQIEYIGAEAYPIDKQVVEQLNYPTLLNAPAHQAVFNALHQCPNQWQDVAANFKYMQQITYFQDISYQEKFNIIYYDAFAPTAQPELWEAPILSRMYQALQVGGVLVTYCAKGVFKRTLKALGFELESLAGPKGKREMVRATRK